MKHMPTGAFSSVPMTISRSRSERTFQPSACVQNRGQLRQVVSVHDDVMESDRHVVSQYARHAEQHPANQPASALQTANYPCILTEPEPDPGLASSYGMRRLPRSAAQVVGS